MIKKFSSKGITNLILYLYYVLLELEEFNFQMMGLFRILESAYFYLTYLEILKLFLVSLESFLFRIQIELKFN